MGYMGNKIEKAELGRATWKFLHTMMARYPEKPTSQERQALHDFMMLFSRLYPCGECATHFNKLLLKYPPQTSSRFAASQWLCAMHNIVNEKLHKPIYDCKDIDSQYPCGCDNSTAIK
ncbi:ERV/ALR sulfhydryl oxidase domain-containing protein [Cokeromyces recurvatus]|uniref:ERV/ALR sulfhydryl oxidase domain-containing protein n=1 Tax=Cokeromyces recurvatus TaxID=90255 RepID=UPI00221EC967|nr:ERV/ALR sulfhydryl oxidase domain-containing protein [Cokeromyces recurvatus]KAI7904177.1 ERV/ALR sulfhydryl oxidase domain-containing protein [Cokeromyces recurvatus]